MKINHIPCLKINRSCTETVWFNQNWASQFLWNTLNLVLVYAFFLSSLSLCLFLHPDHFTRYSFRTETFVPLLFYGVSYSDESPLIPNEFLHEPHITAQDLGGDPILELMNENEHDLWIQYAPSSSKRSLKEKQVNFILEQ